MALRKREKRTERSKIDATPPWETRRHEDPEPTTGPFDVRDAPDDEIGRVDLGALRVPVIEGLDVRLDVNEQQQVVAVTLANAEGHMQLGVFAAPRNEGIWDDVREELRESIVSGKGSAKEQDGPFGTELVGQIAAEGGRTPARFIGVDGPRWFLRALLVGAPAADASKAGLFEEALRKLVVVRGSSPMPVREPVPLQVPKEILAAQPDTATET